MLTEAEWNALDDEAPERQYSNYLDYKNSVSKPSADAVSNQRNVLSRKEQVEADKLNLNKHGLISGMGEDGRIVGPGGIRYDPFKEYIGRDPMTNAPAKYPKGYVDPQTGQAPSDYAEERKEVAEGNAPEGLKKTVEAEEKVLDIPNTTVDETAAKVIDGVRQPKEEPAKEEAKPAQEESAAAESVADAADSSPEAVEDAIDETKKSKKGRYALKSIFQAYHDGDIDESTRDYMVVDAISKFARNLGKDFANIAAAYTGGSIDNEREESLWEQKQNQMAQAGTEQDVREETNEARSEDSNDLDWKAKELGLTSRELQNQSIEISNKLNSLTATQREDLGKEFDKLIAKAPNDTVKTKLLTLKSQATGAGGAQLDQSGLIALAGTEGWSFLKDYLGVD